MVNSRFNLVGIISLFVGLMTATVAQAQSEEVIGKISDFGGLSKKDARTAVDSVSEKIKRAADAFVGMSHPIRRSMRESLFGNTPAAPGQDAVNDAKARLYLYGGLTPQTLSALFKPGPNAITNCTSNFSISDKWCVALIAASARKSVAEVRRASPSTQAPGQGQTPSAPTEALQAAPPTMAHPMPQTAVAPLAGSSQVPLTASPSNVYVPPPQAPVAPVVMAAPMRPVAPASQPAALSTAEQYKAARAKYLSSFKQKKADVGPVSSPTPPKPPTAAAKMPVQPASSAASTQPTAVAAKPAASGSVEEASSKEVAAVEPASKEDGSEKSAKTKNALDPLISDLLADPLSSGKAGKSK